MGRQEERRERLLREIIMKFLKDLLNENDMNAKDIMVKYGDIINKANGIMRQNVLKNSMYYKRQTADLMYEFGDDLDTYPDEAAKMPIDEYTVEYITRPPDGSTPFVLVYDLNKESYENYLHKLRNPPRGNYD